MTCFSYTTIYFSYTIYIAEDTRRVESGDCYRDDSHRHSKKHDGDFQQGEDTWFAQPFQEGQMCVPHTSAGNTGSLINCLFYFGTVKNNVLNNTNLLGNP